MLNKRARKLIGYDKLVSQLAGEIPVTALDELETKHLRERLDEKYDNWEFKDWYRLLIDVKRQKREAAREMMTVEVIFHSMPWAAQQAAQEAVKVLVRKAEKNLLFQVDETAEMAEGFLWKLFYCREIDIKDTATKLSRKKRLYSYYDLKENKLLWDFIKELRDRQWYRWGEVARLRNKEQ